MSKSCFMFNTDVRTSTTLFLLDDWTRFVGIVLSKWPDHDILSTKKKHKKNFPIKLKSSYRDGTSVHIDNSN